VTKHYLAHKVAARALILERLVYWNQFYGYTWHRVAIRNQRRCWGSCSSKGNLNFSYKLLFLPPCLRDYIIVHELCHLAELNHGARFWALVAKQVPDYHHHQTRLRQLERTHGTGVSALSTHSHVYCCGQCSDIG
jgi:predicted metal-dependent hydrolase